MELSVPRPHVGDLARMAIDIECSAIKLGNVHPGASFSDLNIQQFNQAAAAIGAEVQRSIGESVGTIARRCVQAMMHAAGTNTSLGTILLVVPLAVAMQQLSERGGHTSELSECLRDVLGNLQSHDAEEIYAAIREANPGGLGETAEMDVNQAPPASILDAMRVASRWDDIALQYVTDFEFVFELATRLSVKRHELKDWSAAVRCLQVEVLSERVDSLIVRKQGMDFAQQVQTRAHQLLKSGEYASSEYEKAWWQLDHYLRDKDHSGNPGTIADLIAAATMIALLTCWEAPSEQADS